jgi:hypothetical protein
LRLSDWRGLLQAKPPAPGNGHLTLTGKTVHSFHVSMMDEWNEMC